MQINHDEYGEKIYCYWVTPPTIGLIDEELKHQYAYVHEIYIICTILVDIDAHEEQRIGSQSISLRD